MINPFIISGYNNVEIWEYVAFHNLFKNTQIITELKKQKSVSIYSFQVISIKFNKCTLLFTVYWENLDSSNKTLYISFERELYISFIDEFTTKNCKINVKWGLTLLKDVLNVFWFSMNYMRKKNPEAQYIGEQHLTIVRNKKSRGVLVTTFNDCAR